MSKDDDFFRSFYVDRYEAKASGSLRRAEAFLRAEHSRISQRHIVPLLASMRRDPLIADLGSGRSTYLPSGSRVINVDIALQPVSDADGLGIVADLGSLPLADETVDLVVCSQVLEHVQDPSAALDEIVRVLSLGGALLLTVPNRYALMRRRYHSLERKIDTSGHLHEFREGWLHVALGHRGLAIERSEGACYDIYNAIGRLERRRLPPWVWQLLDRVPDSSLCSLMELEARLNGRALKGLSLEIVARKIK